MSGELEADRGQLWIELMRRGDFESAWKFSDEGLRSHAGVPCWHLPRHLQYVWDGTPLHGKRVLVRCYHGLGDTIQFIRYVPLVKAIATEVTVWAQPELITLLRTMKAIDRLLPLHDGTPEVDYDVDIEVMELPHMFRTTLNNIPCMIPYLFAEPALRSRHNGLSVGIVNKAGDWDPRRSIPDRLLAPLKDIPGVEMHTFRHETDGTARHEGGSGARDNNDVLPFARQVKALDLLISVDTMAAHLAGALGVPVWNLLHADADWRWMVDRDDSPWYPTMRLFRQTQSGEWEPVIERVAGELGKLMRGHRRNVNGRPTTDS